MAGACAHPAPDPISASRAVLRAAADRIASGTADAELSPVEREELAGRLRRAAAGRGRAVARARVHGPVGSELVVTRTEEGWRVDPGALAAAVATPAAAIELLIEALDRLETDPALALLTSTLRETVVATSRERARGLREILSRVPAQSGGRVPLQIDYGQGLFVVLRPDEGGWRVDDFN